MRLIRTFREMLGLVSLGNLSKKLDEELETALAALENAPGDKVSAEFTVTLKITRELERIEVVGDYKLKLPKTARFMKCWRR